MLLGRPPTMLYTGVAPQVITATQDPDHFLVSNVSDYNHGLSTLVITRNDDSELESAVMKSLDLTQPAKAIHQDRLDIQRTQSAVLIERDGVQYAIVSDDNYSFNDPYWKAQFEAPMFVSAGPMMPPTAIGGSISAQKVTVGGKLGITVWRSRVPLY